MNTPKHPHVLLVGKFSSDPNIYTYPSSFIPALEAAGALVTIFNVFKNYSLSRLGRLGISLESALLNRKLVKQAQSTKPDIIFMIKGNLITIAALRTIKKSLPQTKIIHFYPDNPFCFWNGNSNTNVLESLPLIDLFIIWSKQLIPIIHSAGCRRVEYFPFAVDETIYKQTSFTSQQLQNYSSDVTFVGTWDTEREKFLTHVVTALPEIQLAIWGNRWREQLPKNSILHRYIRGTAIYKDDLLKAFAGAKIVLNFIRPQNLQAHNMRTFEVLATGNFLLTQKTTEQTQQPFIEDVNIACFADAEDLIKKIAFYVNQDSLRMDVAQRGHVLIAQDFTLRARVCSLLSLLRTEGDRA
jgi:spore maturation protein CgeB